MPARAELSEAQRYLARSYADKIASCDVEAFAWLLGLEFTHNSEAKDAKAMIVAALREYGKRPAGRAALERQK